MGRHHGLHYDHGLVKLAKVVCQCQQGLRTIILKSIQTHFKHIGKNLDVYSSSKESSEMAGLLVLVWFGKYIAYFIHSEMGNSQDHILLVSSSSILFYSDHNYN